MTERKEQLIILGVDGATWDLIDPLIAGGKLPNFRELKERGAWGEVETEYLGSPVIWTAIFTGKDRDKFGDPFFGIDRARLKARRIWEIAAGQGRRVGVLHPLLTWPPLETDGFVIPDIFAMGPETHPSRYEYFQKLYLSRHGGSLWQQAYYFLRSFLLTGGPDVAFSALRFLASTALRPHFLNTFRQRLEVVTRMDFRLFLKLYRQYRPQLCAFHLHAVDTVSHKYWQYKDKPGPYGGVIDHFYALVDRFLGRVMKRLDENTSLVVLADHGFQEIRDERNKFELDVPFLRKQLSADQDVRAVRIGNAYVANLGSGVDPAAASRMTGILAGAVLKDDSPLFVNVHQIDQNIHFRLTRRILESTAPSDEEISFPDGQPIRFGQLFRRKAFVDTGTHAAGRGIFAAYGRRFRSGARLDKVNIFDITPTLLVLLGLPLARDMDGTFDRRWFSDRALDDLRPAEIDTYEEMALGGEGPAEETAFTDREVEDLEERLKMLGYL
jgi:hypothetical protein